MNGNGAGRKGAINLAAVAPFRLGEVEVHPATRQLIRDEQSVTLEPRVMQVLVALAEARGAVLSRDVLIERCWGGVVVGENAIQRAISRIRELAATIGGDSIELETITKVGYRLVVADAAPASSGGDGVANEPAGVHAAPSAGRRALLVGGGALVALGAIGFAGFRLGTRETIPEEAVSLYRRGVDLRLSGLVEQREQIITYFQEAIRIAPRYADAWGALALSYVHLADTGRPDRDSLLARGRSAAERALEIDPGNIDAQVALSFAGRLPYGEWLEYERVARALLARNPDHWLLGMLLGRVMMEVGRWSEAVALMGGVEESNRLAPLMQYSLITALWSAGRLEDAERAIDRAATRWPRHGAIWNTRFMFLTHTGRPEAAIAFASDPNARPTEPSGVNLQMSLAKARTVSSGTRADIDDMVARYLALVERNPFAVVNAIQHCASLGALDETFALCEGYYFGRGRWAASRPAPHTSRLTSNLFHAITSPMRRDPRFAGLVEEIGLEDYWRRSGSRPDYRL